MSNRGARYPALYSARPHLPLCGVLLALVSSACAGQEWAIGKNFSGSTFGTDSFSFPPDTMGAVGNDHYVELLNGRYSVYRKSDGARVQTATLNGFWTNSGVFPLTGSFDPRIQFDRFSQRWYALAADGARSSASSYLLAVSNSADPTLGWSGLRIDADSDNSHWADFPMLGFDRDAVFLSANMVRLTTGGIDSKNFVSLPKTSLLSGTTAGLARFQDLDPQLTGFSAHPVTALDNSRSGAFISAFQGAVLGFGHLKRTDILTPLTAPTLSDAHLSNPTGFGPGRIPGPTFLQPPLADQPGLTDFLNTTDWRISATPVKQGDSIWAAHAIRSSAGFNVAVRWYEFSAVTGLVLQSGTIQDTVGTRDYFFPSIAVNEFGDAVIAFSSSDDDNLFAGAFAVVGRTAAGVTTFSDPFVLKAGLAPYIRLDGATRNRWGDYSSVTIDPTDPRRFWTSQLWANTDDRWD